MNVQLSSENPHRETDLAAELLQNLPGYIQDWRPAEGSKALAIMKIFSHYMEMLDQASNRVPDLSFQAFLQMLGVHKLPAKSARAPLVFTLMDNTPVNVSLPAFSRVAAKPQPVPASATGKDEGTSHAQPVMFLTEKTIALYRGHLSVLYSIDPRRDEYIEHTAQIVSGFTLFDNMSPIEHSIYLGHDQLFNLAGNITVLLFFTLDRQAGDPMQIQWEYLSEAGWFSLEVEDATLGLTLPQGQVKLRSSYGPNAKKETIHGRTTYWIRGRLTTPLLAKDSTGQREIPVINNINARLSLNKNGLMLDAAFADAVSLDISKDFYPFGERPARYSTFYLASEDVFQRKGAYITIAVDLSQAGAPLGKDVSFSKNAAFVEKVKVSKPSSSSPGAVVLRRLDLTSSNKVIEQNFELVWEYYNGIAWKDIPNLQSSISADATDSTILAKYFTDNGVISFSRPDDWVKTSVNGLENYWLRVRIKKGNYGELFRLDQSDPPKLVDSNLQPPVISKLTLGFSYLTDPESLDYCLSYSDFVFKDLTEQCRWPDQTLQPFVPVSDQEPTVHFGFDLPFPIGLVSFYVSIPQEVSASGTELASSFTWEYLSKQGWIELSVLDETQGFQRSGMIQFIGPADGVSALGLGGNLYRIRARLKQGEELPSSAITGLWCNAVWGVQRDSYTREMLGTSDGSPGQTFYFQHIPVLEDEVIEIQEWVGQGDGWRISIKEVLEENLRFVQDPSTGETGVWVRWQSKAHFYQSRAIDRHYVLDRATGLIRFGDGQKGMIPPAGCRVYASYSSGGGLGGNVSAGAISEPRTLVPYISGVSNPVAASGGASIENGMAVKSRGPETIRHSGRAVANRDFEWLAREASSEIARVRCLPLAGEDGHAMRGWVTLMIVPNSPEPQPQPSTELRQRVCDYLSKRVPAAVAGRVRVMDPAYAPIGVSAEIVPDSPFDAALVEARVRSRLNAFLHPLNGGHDSLGWHFGQPVYLSQIAKIVENTPGVDYAKEISLSLQLPSDNGLGQVFNEYVPVNPGFLVCAGTHGLKLILGED